MSSPISGFTAIPNPQMLAFMPIQSYLMMYFAGSGWQYGKRKISAMSNDQFNKLTPEELLKQHSIELKNMLPTLQKSLDDVTPLVRILIEQYGDFIREALKAMPEAIGNIFQQSGIQESQFGITNVRYTPSQDRLLGTQRQKELDRQIQQLLEKAGYTPGTQTKLGPGYQGPPIKSATGRILTRKQKVRLFGDTSLPKSQLGIIERQRQVKRKAGQSQIIHRRKMIFDIKRNGILIKQWMASSPYARRQKWIIAKVANEKRKLLKNQQSLVNLLSRYAF